jgi:F0F1-type ATP synthase assembly protein I
LFKDPVHKKYLEYIGLGAEIAVALSLPILAGYWADTVYNTSPFLLLAGIGVGILIMIGIFSRIIRNMGKME